MTSSFSITTFLWYSSLSFTTCVSCVRESLAHRVRVMRARSTLSMSAILSKFTPSSARACVTRALSATENVFGWTTTSIWPYKKKEFAHVRRGCKWTGKKGFQRRQTCHGDDDSVGARGVKKQGRWGRIQNSPHYVSSYRPLAPSAAAFLQVPSHLPTSPAVHIGRVELGPPPAHNIPSVRTICVIGTTMIHEKQRGIAHGSIIECRHAQEFPRGVRPTWIFSGWNDQSLTSSAFSGRLYARLLRMDPTVARLPGVVIWLAAGSSPPTTAPAFSPDVASPRMDLDACRRGIKSVCTAPPPLWCQPHARPCLLYSCLLECLTLGIFQCDYG